MKKRFLAIVLAVVLCVGSFPVPAQAADTAPPMSNEEMYAMLPSKPDAPVKPTTVAQLEYWGVGSWTRKGIDAETIFQEIIGLTERLTSGSKTDTEKVRAIFDWVASNISYAYTPSGEPDIDGLTDIALGTFFNRRGVCGGYTELSNLMLTLAGIPAAYVHGIARGGGSHGWSAAYADGRWIIFDATWNRWDMSPNFHESVTRIECTTSFARLKIHEAVRGHVFYKVLPGYDCPSEVTIPNSVTIIDGGAFRDCTSLTSMTIPNSVTSIGQVAFYRCNSLTDIYYGGSEAQWSAIDIDNRYGDNAPLLSAAIHYNCVGGFGDVKTGDYCADAVAWAIEKGITNGTGANTFSPNSTCTHAQILTFLWRAAGEPASAAQPPFALEGNEYYAGAVRWAAEKGMIGAEFNEEAPCTRAGAVRYIWYAFGKPAGGGSGFTDVPAGTEYAQAVAWAVGKGVTNGTSATTFAPAKSCDRGEIVTFLYRAFAK